MIKGQNLGAEWRSQVREHSDELGVAGRPDGLHPWVLWELAGKNSVFFVNLGKIFKVPKNSMMPAFKKGEKKEIKDPFE